MEAEPRAHVQIGAPRYRLASRDPHSSALRIILRRFACRQAVFARLLFSLSTAAFPNPYGSGKGQYCAEADQRARRQLLPHGPNTCSRREEQRHRWRECALAVARGTRKSTASACQALLDKSVLQLRAVGA